MFKLVVLSALVAVAVAAPGFLGTAPLAYTSHYAVPAISIPTAVSHQSRTDVFSKPVVAAYAAPAIHSYPALSYAAPIVKTIAPVAYPAAVSHQYRSDVISKPVIASYAAVPQYYHGYNQGYYAPTTYAGYGYGGKLGYGYY